MFLNDTSPVKGLFHVVPPFLKFRHILVLGVLIALLLPSWATAKEAAIDHRRTSELREILRSGKQEGEPISKQAREGLQEALDLIDEKAEDKALAAEKFSVEQVKKQAVEQATRDELAAKRIPVKGAAERRAGLPRCTASKGKLCTFEFARSGLRPQPSFILDGWICDSDLNTVKGGAGDTRDYLYYMANLEQKINAITNARGFDAATAERQLRIAGAGFLAREGKRLTTAALALKAEQQLRQTMPTLKRERAVEGTSSTLHRGEQGQASLHCWQESDFNRAAKLRRAATLFTRDALLAYGQRLRSGNNRGVK